jgi:small redox-active disulfide protein 2
MKIEIFGPGCARCKQTEKNVREALLASGIEAEIIKVEDIRQYAPRGVVFTPAVAIDGELKCTGRIPKSEEVQEWLIRSGVQN